MSRIGNKTITIPAGVEVTINAGNEVVVKGAKGTLTRKFSPELSIEIDGSELKVARPNEKKYIKQLHGTTRALIFNMITGVSQGFSKTLEIVGLGYRASIANNQLTLVIGYSHPVVFDLDADVEVVCKSQTEIVISGIDKQRVGEWAANIRAVRKPEPYKGKGIRYKDEKILRKEGKKAGKK